MAAELLTDASRATDSNASPFAGATWSFYQTGTLTPQPVYANATLVTSLGSVVTADAGGKFVPIYFNAALSYRGILKSADGATTIYDIDPINSTILNELGQPSGAGSIGTAYGMLDDVLDRLLSPITSITVGSGGTYATLVEALDFLKTQTLDNPVTVSLLQKNTPDADNGSMAIPASGYSFNHPNSRNVFFEGPAFGGGQGVIDNTAMTGTKATDLAYCKTRYGASIRINGTDNVSAISGGGLSFPNGVGAFKRILFEERGRYSLDFGYNRSHLNAEGFGGASFEDCAFFGSVWGIIGYNAHFSFNGTGNWFGYQVNGGAMALFRSSAEFVAGASNRLRFYQPPIATADGAKYIIYADNAYLALNADAVAAPILAKGSWLHGLYAINGTSGNARGFSFDGVTQPFTIGDSSVDISGAVIANANPTNTSLVAGSVQPGVPGNEVGGALVSVGSGGAVRHNGFTIATSVAARFVFCNGGQIKGYGTIAVTGSKATTAAFNFAASKGNVLSVTVGTPQGGSLDQSLCQQNADAYYFSSTGITFSPAINTPTNGSGNYN